MHRQPFHDSVSMSREANFQLPLDLRASSYVACLRGVNSAGRAYDEAAWLDFHWPGDVPSHL